MMFACMLSVKAENGSRQIVIYIPREEEKHFLFYFFSLVTTSLYFVLFVSSVTITYAVITKK